MGEQTGISWADRTWSPWTGCAKVSPACDGCYAEHLMATRHGRVVWGKPGAGAGTRSRMSEGYWKKPLTWERQAARTGERMFVFPSLCDPFDNEVPIQWLRDLFDLIRATPHITWLLLTKRPQLIERRYGEAHLDPPDGGSGYDWPQNAWAGATVEDQERARLNCLPLARAASQLGIPLIFLSCEPLLGGLELFDIDLGHGRAFDAFSGVETAHGNATNFWRPLGWVISGGETNQGSHRARPTHPQWKRDLRDGCAIAAIPYHEKQVGEWLHRPEIIDASGSSFHRWPDGSFSEHVGKKRSGRLLDGQLHDAMPGAL